MCVNHQLGIIIVIILVYFSRIECFIYIIQCYTMYSSIGLRVFSLSNIHSLSTICRFVFVVPCDAASFVIAWNWLLLLLLSPLSSSLDFFFFFFLFSFASYYCHQLTQCIVGFICALYTYIYMYCHIVERSKAKKIWIESFSHMYHTHSLWIEWFMGLVW